jgi:hypothetical protein
VAGAEFGTTSDDSGTAIEAAVVLPAVGASGGGAGQTRSVTRAALARAEKVSAGPMLSAAEARISS